MREHKEKEKVITTIYLGMGKDGDERYKKLTANAKKANRSVNNYLLWLDDRFSKSSR